MLWLFSATIPALRAALPTWVPALPEPALKELYNPFTKQRSLQLTYNPNPDGDYEDPPEEAPPPFAHAAIWEPEGRVGWSTLYEVVTGDSKLRLEGGDLFEPESPAARVLYREVLCGRTAPCVCHVPDRFRDGLRAITKATVPALADRWARLARDRFSVPVKLDDWLRAAEASLAGVERWAAATDPSEPWFIWEDGFDW